MRLFNSARVEMIMTRLNIPDDQPIESGMVTKAIKSAQTQVEQQNFEIRKNVLKYDEVLNRQRKVIYAERRKVLEGADLQEQIRPMIDEVIEGYVIAATAEGFPEEWDLEKLWKAFKQLYPVRITVDEVIEESGGEDGDVSGLSAEFITEQIRADAQGAYDDREKQLGTEAMRELERRVVLSVLDRKWREHLYEMDYLQDGIGMRAYGQRDPLVEYQREGFDMFNTMLEGIKEESIGYLFNLEVEVTEETTAEGEAEGAEAEAKGEGDTAEAAPTIKAKGLSEPKRPSKMQYSAPTVDGEGEVEERVESSDGKGEKVSRNAPCPCGSGKKYKRCHGDPRQSED
jgi:preprotein translocase subunit SecA